MPSEHASAPAEPNQPFDLDQFIPDDPLMAQAWVDCLRWACTFPPHIKAYTEATGYQPLRSPIERMIDSATGADRAEAERFIRWFHANVWGTIEPEAAAVRADPEP